jgi:hypothetical protein
MDAEDSQEEDTSSLENINIHSARMESNKATSAEENVDIDLDSEKSKSDEKSENCGEGKPKRQKNSNNGDVNITHFKYEYENEYINKPPEIISPLYTLFRISNIIQEIVKIIMNFPEDQKDDDEEKTTTECEEKKSKMSQGFKTLYSLFCSNKLIRLAVMNVFRFNIETLLKVGPESMDINETTFEEKKYKENNEEEEEEIEETKIMKPNKGKKGHLCLLKKNLEMNELSLYYCFSHIFFDMAIFKIMDPITNTPKYKNLIIPPCVEYLDFFSNPNIEYYDFFTEEELRVLLLKENLLTLLDPANVDDFLNKEEMGHIFNNPLIEKIEDPGKRVKEQKRTVRKYLMTNKLLDNIFYFAKRNLREMKWISPFSLLLNFESLSILILYYTSECNVPNNIKELSIVHNCDPRIIVRIGNKTKLKQLVRPDNARIIGTVPLSTNVVYINK